MLPCYFILLHTLSGYQGVREKICMMFIFEGIKNQICNMGKPVLISTVHIISKVLEIT